MRNHTWRAESKFWTRFL